MLLRLGEAGMVNLLVSQQVLAEIEEVIRRKATQMLPLLAMLLDRSRVEVVPSAGQEILARCRSPVNHPGDAHILADAWYNQVDYFVTLDRAHFLDVPGLKQQLPFNLGTPGDCLAWYRGLLKEEN